MPSFGGSHFDVWRSLVCSPYSINIDSWHPAPGELNQKTRCLDEPLSCWVAPFSWVFFSLPLPLAAMSGQEHVLLFKWAVSMGTSTVQVES